MVDEVLQRVRLRNDFYRDGFYKALLVLALLIAAIILLAAASLYLHNTKPAPVTFATGAEWRVLQEAPVEQPYLDQADLLQWVGTVLQSSFHYDFVNYPAQLAGYAPSFTANGWKAFQALLATANISLIQVQNDKLFINGSAAGAPIIVNQGLLQGRYSWWVQMPVDISYSSVNRNNVTTLILQALVVRVPTTNNINGVLIDNILVKS